MQPGWIHVAIIIPYHQQRPGMLRRAVTSILGQRLPPEVGLQIVIVDDGSPAPVWPEIEGLVFESPFALRVVPQRNAGVAAARNAGLRVMASLHRYVAFLDADDAWPPDHLATALAALGSGVDLYFCDNRREGLDPSCLERHAACLPAKAAKGALSRITPEAFVAAMLAASVAQISTVVYRRAAHPGLLFDPALRHAGEDLLFLAELSQRCTMIGYCADSQVACGRGANTSFGHRDRDSLLRPAVLLDRVAALSAIGLRVRLSAANRRRLETEIATLRRHFVYHVIRQMLKRRRVPPEALRFAEDRLLAAVALAGRTAQLAVQKAMGRTQPQ